MVLRVARARGAHGRPRRQPRLLRDCDAARALAAARGRRPRLGRRRCEVGDDRGGQVAHTERTCRLRARERVAVRRRRAPARARDCLSTRLSGRLRPSSAARPTRLDRHLLRPLERSRPARALARCVRREPSRHGPSRRNGSRACTGSAHGRGGDRSLRRSADGPDRRHLRDRQPRQRRSGPSGAERQRAVRLRRDRGAATVRVLV